MDDLTDMQSWDISQPKQAGGYNRPLPFLMLYNIIQPC